jgi:hypothetical protein
MGAQVYLASFVYCLQGSMAQVSCLPSSASFSTKLNVCQV